MTHWETSRLDNGWRFAGPCPRCKHQAEKVILDDVIVLAVAATDERPATDRYVVHCSCDQDHPDRPAGEKGCGAYWGVEIQHEESAADTDEGER